jgi:DNA polymerase-3 subunit gamma/tau
MLGTLAQHHVIELLDALAVGDSAGLLQHIAVLDEAAPDYDQVLADLLNTLQIMALLQAVPEAPVEDDGGHLKRLSHVLSAEDIQLYYQFALQGRRDLPWVPQARGGFEMVMLRMLCFTLDGSEPVLAGPVTKATRATLTASPKPAALKAGALNNGEAGRARSLLQAVQRSKTEPVSTVTPSTPSSKITSAPTTPIKSPTVGNTAPAPASTPTPVVQASQPAIEKATPVVSAVTPSAAIERPEPEPDAVDQITPVQAVNSVVSDASTADTASQDSILDTADELTDWAAHWHDIVAALPLQGMAMQLAKQTVVKAVAGNRLTLGLAQNHSGLYIDSTTARLHDALNQRAGRELKLKIEIDTEAVGNTPAQADARRQAEQLQLAEQQIQDDPNVQALQSRFDASIRSGSVQILDE